MVALLVLLTALVFLTLDYFVQRRRAVRATSTATSLAAEPFPKTRPTAPRCPLGVYVAPGHVWAFLEPAGTAILGITDFARSLVGTAKIIDVRAEGDTVSRGDVVLQFRHANRKAKFFSPIDGVVEKVQINLSKRVETDSDENYLSSWLLKVRPKDTSQIPQTMLLGEQAVAWLRREVDRFSVFLATVPPERRALGVTMPDGGTPSSNLIQWLSDSDWEKVQQKFFDASDGHETKDV